VTGVQDREAKRQADVYVFALLSHADKATIDPLNVSQWQFYVLPTSFLNARRSERSITLKKLVKLCGEGIRFQQLAAAVEAAGVHSKRPR
jgi:hypothetical protein